MFLVDWLEGGFLLLLCYVCLLYFSSPQGGKVIVGAGCGHYRIYKLTLCLWITLEGEKTRFHQTPTLILDKCS